MENLLRKLYDTNSVAKDELLYLLSNMNEKVKHLLFNYADKVRLNNYGKKVYIRGLIEFTNHCKNTCLYCGLRCENRSIRRYRLTPDEIIECCAAGDKMGIRTFVLQGGEDRFYTDDLLADIVKRIKKTYPYCAVTLSIGERSYLSYKRLFEAGADRYLLRHETASKELYEKLHPGMDFENRKECLANLKRIGYQVGAGFIVELPGQNNDVLVEDLLYLKRLKPHMVGIGPLIVHPQTPLKDCAGGTADKTLICLALTRLLLPDVLLPATTALSVVDDEGCGSALKAGANVIMLNITPTSAREKYEIYKGKSGVAVDMDRICEDAIKAGYNVALTRGDHKEWIR